MRNPEQVLVRPLLTEKLLKQSEAERKYGFEVLSRANKIDIKHAVEYKFNVKVKSVNVIVAKGKRKRMNTRRGMTFGKRSDVKRAIVTLEDDNKIDFFEGLSA